MIYPEALIPGDYVAIIAPAGRIGKDDLEKSVEILESWDLKVQIGKHVFDMNHYFSSTDKGRYEDLQRALDDPKIKAIFCARGGYGTGRIIDILDFRSFLQFPKWIIGFSDITVLHLKLLKSGVASVHGPVARQIGKSVDTGSVELLKKILFEMKEIRLELPFNKLNLMGKGTGRITGGNLTLICNSMGTTSEPDFEDMILFIEEIDEKLYAFDRYLNQLDRGGKLEKLKGIIVGQLTDMKDTEPPFGITAQEIVREYAAKYNLPICFGFDAGHESRNLPIPFLFSCDLEIGEKGSFITFFPG